MNGAIKAEDLPAVKEMARQHDEITNQLEDLEEKRLAISDALATLLGFPNHPNLSRIIEKLPPNRSAKLTALKTGLKTVIGELKGINSTNRILLIESLHTIAKIFEFIDIAKAKLSGYKYQGKKASALITRTMINTVA
jgi:flagellar biosynthesis/type III secretory pathway chaperone